MIRGSIYLSLVFDTINAVNKYNKVTQPKPSQYEPKILPKNNAKVMVAKKSVITIHISTKTSVIRLAKKDVPF